MSDYDETLHRAQSLSPNERLKLIARLWASLPQEFWPAPTDDELAEAHRLAARQGIARDDHVSWPIVEQMLADSVRSSRPKVYSTPRRFDLATIFVVTSAYAMLFAAMAGLSFPPMTSILCAAFITIVGIGQAVLFGGHKPRTASMIAGAAVYCFSTLASFLYFSLSGGPPGPFLLVAIVSGAFSGAILGYIAGALVGGVFLVADKFRQRFLHPPEPAGAEEIVDEGTSATS